jgi:tetrachloro-p-hydroquinone reductive dehalogenase
MSNVTLYNVGRLVALGLAKKVKTLKRYAEKHPELREAYLAKLADMQALQQSKADPSVTAENRKNLAACLDDMDTLLAERPYLAGDSYSLADVIWTVVLTRIELSKQLSLVEVRPNVLGYYRRMQARPSYESADLWPRFKFLRSVPMAVHALGPRIAVAATVLAGVSAALWYWM